MRSLFLIQTPKQSLHWSLQDILLDVRHIFVKQLTSSQRTSSFYWLYSHLVFFIVNINHQAPYYKCGDNDGISLFMSNSHCWENRSHFLSGFYCFPWLQEKRSLAIPLSKVQKKKNIGTFRVNVDNCSSDSGTLVHCNIGTLEKGIIHN